MAFSLKNMVKKMSPVKKSNSNKIGKNKNLSKKNNTKVNSSSKKSQLIRNQEPLPEKPSKTNKNQEGQKDNNSSNLSSILVFILIIVAIFALLSLIFGNPFKANNKMTLGEYDYFITATEGDVISLKTLAPLDGFDVVYSEPFDSFGVFVTKKGDSKEYSSNITLKRGNESQVRKVYIKVEPKVSEKSIITPKSIIGHEGQKIAFGVSTINSLDNPLNSSNVVEIKNLPEEISYQNGFIVWDIGFGTIKKNFFTKLIQFLGVDWPISKTFNLELEYLGEKAKTQITIYDTNQAPVFLEEILELTLEESNKAIKIPKGASEYDGDFLNYQLYNLDGNQLKGLSVLPKESANYELRASDGLKKASQLVQLTVIPKEAPVEELVIPSTINLKEGQPVQIKAVLSKDSQIEKMFVKDLPDFMSIEGEYLIFNPSFDIASKEEPRKSFNLSLEIKYQKEISNGEYERGSLAKEVYVTVSDINRAPIVLNVNPEMVFDTIVDNPINFSISAKDPDGDELEYRWELGKYNQDVGNVSFVYYSFTTPGEKSIKVHICDGIQSVTKEWIVDVWDYESYKLIYPIRHDSNIASPKGEAISEEVTEPETEPDSNKATSENQTLKITWVPRTLIFYT